MKLPSMSLALLMLLLSGFFQGGALAQGAWCEANCKALCLKIYGKSGAGECIARIPCRNYAGKPCAPASVVNARYVTFCHSNPGKGTCR